MSSPLHRPRPLTSLLTPKRGVSQSVMPSPLQRNALTPRYVPKPSSMADLDRKFPAVEQADDMYGKAGVVYLATSNPGRQPVAIKRQYLDDPNDKQSTGYRELMIMQHIHKSVLGTHNFIKLLDWNKCWLQTTPKKPSKKRKRKGKARKEKIQCMNLVMQQAGEPIINLAGPGKNISLYLFKQILFQVLYSLAKAQAACEFMHNDLHLRNILIDRKEHNAGTKYHQYQSPDGVWLVDSSIVITIVDFGLSRITLEDGSVIHNEVHHDFHASRDSERLSKEFTKFRISSWEDTLESASCSEEEIKTRKSLKRKFMGRMTRGDSPATLIQHAFFDSMKVDRFVQDAIVSIPSAPISYSPPKPERIEPASVSRTTVPSPMSPMTEQLFNRSNPKNIKSCIPKALPILRMTRSATKLQQNIATKTKKVATKLAQASDKENIAPQSVLQKRKSALKQSKTSKSQPAFKRQRTT